MVVKLARACSGTPIAAAIFFRRRRRALRPLLGRGRGLPQPAFRDVLLPGHRVLHRAAACERFEPGTQGEHKVSRAASSRRSPGRRTGIADPRFRARHRRAISSARARRSMRTSRAGARARALSRRAAEARSRECTAITWLSPKRSAGAVSAASSRRCDEPDGLLAAGGDLSPARLLAAYRRGIFPWYSRRPADAVVVARIRARCCSRTEFRVLAQPRQDAAQRRLRVARSTGDFAAVIAACAAPRAASRRHLDHAGDARRLLRAAPARLRAQRRDLARRASWSAGSTACALGGVFFGESMFSRERDASKVALARLVERAAARAASPLIDCQMATPHLRSLGAAAIPRAEFLGACSHSARELRAATRSPVARSQASVALH